MSAGTQKKEKSADAKENRRLEFLKSLPPEPKRSQLADQSSLESKKELKDGEVQNYEINFARLKREAVDDLKFHRLAIGGNPRWS